MSSAVVPFTLSSPAAAIRGDPKQKLGVGMKAGNLLFRRKLSIFMGLTGSSIQTSGFEVKTAAKYSKDEQEQLNQEPPNPYPTEELVERPDMDMHMQKEGSLPPKKSAKIHDFCLGIPYGGFVFGVGLLGFLFSRNSASVTTGMLFGGAILALGTFSLKVWRKGQSSSPFILGQAAIAAALLGMHFRLYSLTKKLFPSGFFVLMSAAMICFYSYVLISGGNPPPKKLRVAPPS
ncbi:protein FATTY ACID EXPORT 1, chloroplastic isoform X1 [Elaeis guineensis]